MRQFFICGLMANGKFVSMPSKAVDELWHEFILFTRDYQDFYNSTYDGAPSGSGIDSGGGGCGCGGD